MNTLMMHIRLYWKPLSFVLAILVLMIVGWFALPDTGSTETKWSEVPVQNRAVQPQKGKPSVAPKVESNQANPIVPISMNGADAAAWQTVPGIGVKRAEAIIALRTAKGGFRKKEDLLEIKGIGPKTLAKMLPWLLLP